MARYTVHVSTLNGKPLKNGTPCEVTFEFNFASSANKAAEKKELREEFGDLLIIKGDLGIIRYEAAYDEKLDQVLKNIKGKRTDTLEGGKRQERFTSSESFLNHYSKDE